MRSLTQVHVPYAWTPETDSRSVCSSFYTNALHSVCVCVCYCASYIYTKLTLLRSSDSHTRTYTHSDFLFCFFSLIPAVIKLCFFSHDTKWRYWSDHESLGVWQSYFHQHHCGDAAMGRLILGCVICSLCMLTLDDIRWKFELIWLNHEDKQTWGQKRCLVWCFSKDAVERKRQLFLTAEWRINSARMSHEDTVNAHVVTDAVLFKHMTWECVWRSSLLNSFFWWRDKKGSDINSHLRQLSTVLSLILFLMKLI